MSIRRSELRRHLNCTSSHPQTGTLGLWKRRGLAQSPTAPEASADSTSNPDLAPPGGSGAPGGECALTQPAQAEGDPEAGAAVLDVLIRDRNNPSEPRGPGQAMPPPVTLWGGGGRNPRPPGQLGKSISSWRPGSPGAVRPGGALFSLGKLGWTQVPRCESAISFLGCSPFSAWNAERVGGVCEGSSHFGRGVGEERQ